MNPAETSALGYALVGYLVLQVALNTFNTWLVRRSSTRLATILKAAFWSGVANALYFLTLAVVLRATHLVETREPPAGLWLHALLGVPVGVVLWFVLTIARKAGRELFGRGELALAEEAMLTAAPNPRYLSWSLINLITLQPLGRELFLRGLFLPVAVRHFGWGWAIGATLLIELLLRLNVAWVFQTVVYSLSMVGLFYLTGSAMLGLTAAMTAGAIQGAVLLKQRVRRIEAAVQEALT
jgi:hypothetical protein